LFIHRPTRTPSGAFPSARPTQQKRNYHDGSRRKSDPEDDPERARHS
jgi:hypothetical protein